VYCPGKLSVVEEGAGDAQDGALFQTGRFFAMCHITLFVAEQPNA